MKSRDIGDFLAALREGILMIEDHALQREKLS